MTTRIFAHVRRGIVRGLLLVLPLLITLWLLSLLFELMDRTVTPWVIGIFEWAGMPELEGPMARAVWIPLIGLVMTAMLVYALGLLAGNLTGRRLLSMVERYILKVPLIGGVYGAARQLLDAFGMSGERAFTRVVVVEYPRQGLWTVGFVTSEVEHEILDREGGAPASTVAVFLPTTPNPTSGWMLLVPRKDLRVLDMTIEEGIKLIVSGGIVSPDNLGDLMDWPADAERPPRLE